MKNTLLIHFEGRDNRWSKEKVKYNTQDFDLAIGKMELPFTEMDKTVGRVGLRKEIRSFTLIMET